MTLMCNVLIAVGVAAIGLALLGLAGALILYLVVYVAIVEEERDNGRRRP